MNKFLLLGTVMLLQSCTNLLGHSETNQLSSADKKAWLLLPKACPLNIRLVTARVIP